MKNRCFLYLFVCVALMGVVPTAQAELRLPRLFQQGMVLQRGKPIPVWGWAVAGQQVSVSIGKKTLTTQADEQGCWRVDMPVMKAGGPYTMTIKGSDDECLTIDDVLVGDVWLCSGQSNIDVTIERVYPQYTTEIDAFDCPQVRLFRVQNDTDTHDVRQDIRPTSINWLPLTKTNAWGFSAVGSFLGKRMHQKTGVPQGIIVNSWGGTPIEAWISADSLRNDYPMLLRETEYWDNAALREAYQQAGQQADQQWFKVLNEHDPGMPRYTATDYDDSQWPTVDQYDHQWGRQTGSVWLRQHIYINKERARKPARLLLGTLYDMDQTYVNGQHVGTTYYQYPPRRYDIPEGLLHEGDNVITVRFVNKYGQAYFIREKPYMLVFGPDRESQNPIPADTIALSSQWRYQTGAQMLRQPGGGVSVQNLPTTLYNAVLHPLAPFALSGVVWYQGESNAGNPAPYADLLRRMMGCWRNRWQQSALPFCIVQLANFMQPSELPQPKSGWAQLREAQRLVATADPYAALAVINDLGETVDIHPLRKKEVAERIGRCFDRLVFGEKKTLLSPEVIASEVSDNTIILTLDQPVVSGSLCEFEVAGSDGQFHNVEAQALGSRITLTPSSLSLPLTVRYAWKDNPLRANVRSLTGLPMSSFELQVK